METTTNDMNGVVTDDQIVTMYNSDNYYLLKNIKGMTMKQKKDFVKKKYEEIEFNNFLEFTGKMDDERIKIIYNTNNFSYLKKFATVCNNTKKLHIKELYDKIIIKEHNAQLSECIMHYGITIDEFNAYLKNNYNIFNDWFKNKFIVEMEVIKNNVSYKYPFPMKKYDDILIFGYHNEDFKKLDELQKLDVYNLLTQEEKQVVVTFNYYKFQKNKIDNCCNDFCFDIFANVLSYVSDRNTLLKLSTLRKKKSVEDINASLELLAIWKNVNLHNYVIDELVNVIMNKVFVFSNGVKCDKCNNYSFHVTIGNKCNFCDVNNTIVKCDSYQNVKCYGCNFNVVCVGDMYVENKVYCGGCLKTKVYYKTNVPKCNWAKCGDCSSQFFVKENYLGYNAKCLMHRVNGKQWRVVGKV